jgi:hypothetical protein
MYIADDEVGCRHCHDLRYASQSESAANRAMRKERRIRKKLGLGPNLTVPIITKPKFMHWKTFLRLRSAFSRATFYNLPAELRPRSIKLGNRHIIIEPPADYLARLATAQEATSTGAA